MALGSIAHQWTGRSPQMVILAGGLATRLHPLTEKTSKSMVVIGGKPFLQYQIELLRSQGITNIMLCIGHLGHQIKDYFGNGRRFGVNICFSEEKGELLGTAGAIKNAEGLLEDEFLLMYGDSYLMLDYAEIIACFRRLDPMALMVVYRNLDRYDRSNIVLDGNRVEVYDKMGRAPGMVFIDAGLSVLKREVLRYVPDGEAYSLEELYQWLIEGGELLAFETQRRFYEIGSPKSLEEFGQLVASGGMQA